MATLVLKPSGSYVQNALMTAAQNALAKGEYRQAWLAYRKILRDTPHNAEIWIKLGEIFCQWRYFDIAEICFYRGLWLHPEDGESLAKLADFYRQRGDLAKAQKAIEKAQALSATNPMIAYSAGLIFREMGSLDAARHAFDAAQQLGFEGGDLLWDFAVCDFLAGDFSTGFARLHGPATQKPDAHSQSPLPSNQQQSIESWLFQGWPIKKWAGEDLTAQTILVVGDAGYGDVIQMLRFIPLLLVQAKTVILAVDATLLPLVTYLKVSKPSLTVWDLQTLLGSSPPMPQNDMPVYYVQIGALPFYFPDYQLDSQANAQADSQDDFPPQIPYIMPPETADLAALSATSCFKIGLVWAGDNAHANDHNRSMALADFSPVFHRLGVEFYALQTGAARQQLAQTGFDVVITDMAEAMGDFSKTARLLTQLDMVISVDTAMAHLAGAMGKEVWVLLPFSPDWRWGLHHGETHWYPTMRLYRQTSPGDWHEVITRLCADLVIKLDQNTDGMKINGSDSAR